LTISHLSLNLILKGEVLQLLLRSGADPNAADFKTQDTPLHLACDVTRGLSRDSSRDHPGTQDAELVRLLVGDPRTDCLKVNSMIRGSLNG
jgi:hypothetical protein